jgi:GGDEF domain-containing protein
MLLVKLFENNLYLIIAVGILFLFLIAIILIYVGINKDNKKFLANISSYNEDYNYTFQFDFEKNIIQIYRRAKNVEYCSFRFEDFRKMIIIDQQTKYDDFIYQLKSCKATDNVNASFAVKIDELFGENYRWLRFSLEHVRAARNIVYCSAFASTAYRRRKVNSEEIINLNMFKLRVEEVHASKGVEGTIYVVNCNLLDLIRRRYGQEIANNYLLAIIHTFHELNDSKTLVGHYKNDSFLIYKEETFKTNQSEALKKNVSLVCERIEFDKYQFNIKPTFGASVVGRYSDNVSDVIEEAVRASALYNNSVVLYDDQMFEEEQNSFKKIERIRNLLNKAKFNTNYYPVISLQNGVVMGALSELDFSVESTFKGIDLDDENHIELRQKFYEVSFRNSLEKFISDPNYRGKRLFIFADIDLLTALQRVYLSKLEYASVQLVVVVNSYDQFLEYELETSLFESLKRNKMMIGVVADETMKTIYDPLLEYVSYIILPKKMIHTINIDQRMHMNIGNIVELMDTYGIQSIASDVQSVAQAEVLKSLGVVYMSGPLFDDRSKSTNSQRRLGKLLDEN